MRLSYLFVAGLTALVGCTPDLLPGKFACSATQGCPPDWFCHSDMRCYPTAEDGGVGGTDAGEPCGGSCDDQQECTNDFCDLVNDECVNLPIEDGTVCGAGAPSRCCSGVCADTSTDAAACGASCSVCGANEGCAGESCGCVGPFRDCDTEPGCEVNIQSDPAHCGGCDSPCAPGESCVSGSCGACNSPIDCDDGLDCTTDDCRSNECEVDINEGSCVINGTCVANGEMNPSNPCEVCNSALDNRDWSNNDGASCESDDLCIINSECRSRACSGGEPRCPDDGFACNGTESCTKGECRRLRPQCLGWDRTPGENCAGTIIPSCRPCGGSGQSCCVNYGNGRPPCNSGFRFCSLGGTC